MDTSSNLRAATKDTNVINTVSTKISRSLEDGGSSVGLTQGEIIFVTLACFVVVIASIFAIYSVYKRRRQANKSITTPPAAVMSPAIAIGNGTEQFPTSDVNNSMVSRESIEERNRRATLDSVESAGGKKARRASTGSAGSNVSKQYKVAAINQMRRMSELSEP
mmetsp:Transcript_20848/g.32646  ORF Transcript_20848/g.32646 Transcript_20848/m.32646 type:complete len:164 (+) Transcript_20848:165-656(+)